MQREMMKRKDAKIKMRYISSFLFALMAAMTISALSHADTTLHFGWITHDVLVHIKRVGFLLLILFLLPFLKIKTLNLNSILAIFSVLIMLTSYAVSAYDSVGTIVFSAALCIIFCISPKDIQRRAFEFFKIIWVVVCILGIFCYLSYSLQLPVPYEIVQYYFGNDLRYVSYGISYLYDSGISLRLCGICNEPGYFGTFCALMLCVEKMNLREKNNIIVLIAGILTFSVAFYMIMVIYCVARLLVGIKSGATAKSRILRCASAFLVVCAYFLVLPNMFTGNQYIDHMLQRLTITSEGVVGDDRTTDEFDELFGSTPFYEMVMGKGVGYSRDIGVTRVLSYKKHVLEYGLIPSMLIWGALFAAVLRKNVRNRDIVLFVLVFFASIYQRPYVISLPYLLILIGGIEYIKSVSIMKIKKGVDEDVCENEEIL